MYRWQLQLLALMICAALVSCGPKGVDYGDYGCCLCGDGICLEACTEPRPEHGGGFLACCECDDDSSCALFEHNYDSDEGACDVSSDTP